MKKNIIKSIALASIIFTFMEVSSFADNTSMVDILPIFTEADGQWYPGRIQSNDFSIKNNRSKGIKVDRLSIKLTSTKNYKTGVTLNENSSEFKEISENSIVTLKQGDTVLFEKKMNQLLEEEWTPLSKIVSIDSDSDAKLNMTIDMDKENITNNAQAIESVFSIGLTYKEDEEAGFPDIDEDEIEGVVKPNTNNGNLPQTGGIINSATLTFLGALAIGTGLVIEKQSSSRKGGKDNE